MINVVSSEQDTYERCRSLLIDKKPCFLARIGGSDTDAIMAYRRHPNDRSLFAQHRKRCQEFNGFYARDVDIDCAFIRYMDILEQGYKSVGDIFVGGSRLQTIYYPQRIGVYRWKNEAELSEYAEFMDDLFAGERVSNFYSYDFMGRIVSNDFTFFRLLSEVLPGKRVLVVSPFGRSIVEQQKNKYNLFKDFSCPDFTIVPYDTPVTYSGLPDEMYPDGSWDETASRMQSEIAQLDFDIALLCCGSYAMPLGTHIRDVCGKDAVYVGGCLQLFFGVMGRRWSGQPYFMNQMYPENFIAPSEGQKFLKHVTVDANTQTEAFGAYF